MWPLLDVRATGRCIAKSDERRGARIALGDVDRSSEGIACISGAVRPRGDEHDVDSSRKSLAFPNGDVSIDLNRIGRPVSAIIQVRLAVYLSAERGVQMWHVSGASRRDTCGGLDPTYVDGGALKRRGKLVIRDERRRIFTGVCVLAGER